MAMNLWNTCRLLCVWGLLLWSNLQAAPTDGEPEFLVVGYLPEYRIKAFDTERTGSLTDIVLFSVEPRADGTLDTSRLTPWLGERLRNLQSRASVRWQICVGGGGRSEHFAAMASRDVTRRKFVAQIVDFCRQHNLSGVDLDWEHPATPEEVKAHGRLLVELRAHAHQHGLTLSIAVAAWQTLSHQAIQAVDRVHLMAYNAGGPHATYERAVDDIERLVRQGIPAEKICLGIPFYGRQLAGERKTMTYAQIVEDHAPGPQVNQVDGYYFNGRHMVSRKLRLAQNRRLQGVMIWEIGQDSSDSVRSLLGLIGAELKP